ncbi:hypothetical protein B9Z55_004146 [Caenorhabditis nigoni]|uniref:Uncharacterized protein n=1 Tax=Caenorhabditis nigoni TaxID=1611254 RepID=A0A2G5UV06_9PELO|nr:hypothetical protein B9Z55_004146 [Caenorhabditis nigoni]
MGQQGATHSVNAPQRDFFVTDPVGSERKANGNMGNMALHQSTPTRNIKAPNIIWFVELWRKAHEDTVTPGRTRILNFELNYLGSFNRYRKSVN